MSEIERFPLHHLAPEVIEQIITNANETEDIRRLFRALVEDNARIANGSRCMACRIMMYYAWRNPVE